MATRRRRSKKKINWEWIAIGAALVAISIFSFARKAIVPPVLPAGNGANGSTSTPTLPPAGTPNSYNCNLPRGLRNNNPSNFRSGNWQGVVANNTDYNCSTKQVERKYLQFQTIEYGILALIQTVYGVMFPAGATLRSILAAIPNATGNAAYLNAVASTLGVSPDKMIALTRYDLERIVKAIARYENGREAITTEQFEYAWTVLFKK